jgi:hypothetical protein
MEISDVKRYGLPCVMVIGFEKVPDDIYDKLDALGAVLLEEVVASASRPDDDAGGGMR